MAHDTPVLTAEDLGLDTEELVLDGSVLQTALSHPYSLTAGTIVYDLPQLYTKPSAKTILATLQDLRSQPSSWENTPRSGTPRSLSGASTPLRKKPKVRSNGVPQYLTKIISSSLAWIEDEEEKELVWETAAQRLSERSGRTAMGDIVRAFSIPLKPFAISGSHIIGGISAETALTPEIDEDVIEISLHEPALTGDKLGLKTWASSYLLAKRLCLLQDVLPKMSENDWILELGAGTGLVGIAAAAVFQKHVVLTDLAEIVPNLERNIHSNAATIKHRGGNLSVATLDWSQPANFSIPGDESQRHPTQSPKLILAADPIYSGDHPRLLVQAISYHLSRDVDGRVIVEMPIREAFGAERDDFRHRMFELGLAIVQESEEFGIDDWAISGSGNEDEPVEVKCWWSAWGWMR